MIIVQDSIPEMGIHLLQGGSTILQALIEEYPFPVLDSD